MTAFETKVEQMGKFVPKAVEEYVEFDPSSELESNINRIFYDDDFYFLIWSNYGNPQEFAYMYKFEKDQLYHRLGGPAFYEYNENGLKNIRFFYAGKEFSEEQYWYKLALMGIGVQRYDEHVLSEEHPYFRYTDFSFDYFKIRFFRQSKRFHYFVCEKKVKRSEFYKIVERRISRIRA